MSDAGDWGFLPPKWRKLAACRGHAEVMFDESRIGEAKDICAGCTVLEECRDFVLDAEVEEGVWAGMVWAERVTTCPICLDEKPPGDLGCSMPHDMLRLARLMEQLERGAVDVELPPRQIATARANPHCPLPRGNNHSTSQAYRRGCRCEAARAALRRERSEGREAC